MPTPSLEKAAAFAELSKKHGGLFVFATRSAKLLSHENASAEIAKHKFAEHACADCGTHFEMVKAGAMQPFCITCGSEHVKVLAEVKPKVPSDSELASVSCSCCGTKTVIRPELASVAGSIHCTACGTAMTLKKATADVEIDGQDSSVVDADDLDLIDLEDDPIDEETAENTQGDPETEAPALSPDAVAPSTTTQESDPEAKTTDLPADPVEPNTTLQEPAPEISDADESEDDLDAGDDGEDDDEDFDVVDVDMVEELDGDDNVELSFVHIGKDVHLIGKQQIIATLTEEAAGDNASIMHTEEFRRAVAHSISTLGLKKAVAQYGFKPATIKVKLDKTFAKKVEASVEKKAKELSAARNEVFEDVAQALDISAAGFAGNFWRNKVDPLKVALANELKAVGVKNSVQFVDRVFAAHGVAHIQQVLELAKELIKKPIEARNALAQAIDLAKYQPMVVKASDESDDEMEDEDTEEDDDVLAVATPVSEPVVASTSNRSKSPYRSPVLASILGNGNLPFSQ